MTISMQYSMAGVLDDNDLAELASYTEPKKEDVLLPEEEYNNEELVDTETTESE
jgi:hypothetical protein